jgi:hypothetical protein
LDDNGINRREFPRLQLSDHAVAMDEQGRELGRVTQASGGGMRLTATPELAEELNVGQKMRVTIVEPATQTSNTIDVMIRYNDGENIGFEFVSGRWEAAGKK